MKVEKMTRKQVWECPELQKLPINWTSIKFPDSMEGVPDGDEMCVGPAAPNPSPCNTGAIFFS